ncbi:MAG: D-2-hydroxyacid dehydrogenase (NADP+) [Flavobacterium sp.]|jgi:D-2-hydroxyacid dehydrogenase (NADP+)
MTCQIKIAKTLEKIIKKVVIKYSVMIIRVSKLKQLYIYLKSEDSANHFESDDFKEFIEVFPDVELIFLQAEKDLIAALPKIEWLDTWYFQEDWFSLAPKLQAIFTPAAGKDWVHADPSAQVPIHHGTFHGPMIAEVMVGMMLYFNRQMPKMQSLQKRNIWDRNLQGNTAMLCNQKALIVGYGMIGKSCGRMLTSMGMQVFGYQRKYLEGYDVDTNVRYVSDDRLNETLALADHVIMLLPGGHETRHFISKDRLSSMKNTAYLYNFGRGTTISEEDLCWALDGNLVAGAGLDVTEVEPLPLSSELWARDDVLLTPHSSCVFKEYQALHVHELVFLVKKIVHM